MATRCCCPPESRSGYSSRLSERPNRDRRSSAERLGLALRHLQRLDRRERDVAQDGHVREEVERLEHDADAAADRVHVDARPVISTPCTAIRPGVDRLQQVHASEQRGLPRARGADEAYDLVLIDGEIDPAQDLVAVEGLVDALELERLGVRDRAHRRRPNADAAGRR